MYENSSFFLLLFPGLDCFLLEVFGYLVLPLLGLLGLGLLASLLAGFLLPAPQLGVFPRGELLAILGRLRNVIIVITVIFGLTGRIDCINSW